MLLLMISRWLHILAGLAWVGEVITINFVILPTLKSLPRDSQGVFIRTIFPKIFRLATVLALVSILAGIINGYLLTGWRDIVGSLKTNWGMGIIGGAVLTLLLFLFHLLFENKLKPQVENANDQSIDQTIRVLGIIPRLGLVIIIVIALLMFFGASAG